MSMVIRAPFLSYRFGEGFYYKPGFRRAKKNSTCLGHYPFLELLPEQLLVPGLFDVVDLCDQRVEDVFCFDQRLHES